MVKIRTEDKVVDTSSISKTDVLYAEIEDITKDELLNPEFIPSIFSNYNNENERDEVLTQVLARAGKLKIKTKVKKMIDKLFFMFKALRREVYRKDLRTAYKDWLDKKSIEILEYILENKLFEVT